MSESGFLIPESSGFPIPDFETVSKSPGLICWNWRWYRSTRTLHAKAEDGIQANRISDTGVAVGVKFRIDWIKAGVGICGIVLVNSPEY